ncbi:MAG: lactate permease LctP family transporter [Candidatus Latescibacter sp.]|nr:lactate permease LctP family transporter [Candidatus Latescibacter sp.]
MPWTINIDPLGNIYLSALLASLSIIYLFWALAYKRMKGHWAALSAVSITVLISIIGYGMPVKLSLLATLNGAMFGLWPIVWIVITGLFLYNLSVQTGQFEIIKNSLASMTDDRRMQALLIAFSFGAFIEGCAGFGTPVAITAAVLMGLGFKPIYAAGICLLANTAPVAFGSIGIPILVAGQVSGVDTFAISQMAGRTLPFISVIIPFYIVILMSGWKKGIEVWPAALVSGGSFALSQCYTSNYLGPLLPDIISSIVSILCLTIFLRFWHPKQSWTFDHEPDANGRAALLYTGGQVFRAWAPFIILTVFVGAWGIKPIKAALDYYALIKIPIPGLDTMVIRDGKAMAAVYNFNILSAAGTAVLLSGLFSIPVMGASLAKGLSAFWFTVKCMRWPMVTMASILGFAYIMNYSGMAITLGNAFATTGVLFPFFAAFLGWLGVFMTGSDTSSNALFGKLQEVTATQIGVDPVVTVTANSIGGVCGKMISPQSLAVATAAVGLVGHEGDIFRFTIKHSIILTTVVGVMTCLQAYVFTWIIPVYQKGAATAAVNTAAAQPVSQALGLTCLAITFGLILSIAILSRAVGKARGAKIE